jgi:hypothetical protein
MNFRLSLLLFLIFVAAAAAGAQTCRQPSSIKFDGFSYTNIADAKERLQKFEAAVMQSAEAKGFIYVYGGKKSRVNEIPEMMAEVKQALKMGDSNFTAKYFIVSHGYRNLPTIELFIKPLPCSEHPSAGDSAFKIEEIEFAEAPAESTLKKSTAEINNSLVKKSEAVCPPAARAVRACNYTVQIYVIIDQKGNVIFASAVSGHPLLQQAGVYTVKSWKFQPAKIEDKTYNVAGYINVGFRQPNEKTN